MYCRCLAPSVQGPQRLLVSPVHAGRSSGESATYSERPRGGRGRPPAGRGNQSRDDPRDEHRDERRGRWRDERRGGRREENWGERREERGYDRGRNDRSDGGSGDSRGQEAGGGVEYDTGKRYGSYRLASPGEGRLPDRERGRGESGGFGGSRRDREVAPEPDDRRRSSAGGGSRDPQQQARRQQQQPLASRGREDHGNMGDQADDDYDGEYDEVDDEGAGPAGRRAGGGGGPCLRDTLEGEALYGVFPVLAALRAKRRRVHRAFMLASLDLSKRKDAGLIRQVEALCTEAGVEVVRTSRHELNLMSHDRPHQGLVLDVSPLEWASLDEFPYAERVMQTAAAEAARGAAAGPPPPPPVWLALDEVVDPQNLGAVVRSAYCLGAAGVLACSRNCAPLSAVVSKASAGALEALQLHSCHNLPRTLLDARDNKGWAVLGAAAGSGSEPVGRVQVDRPTILVLGSEGFGLRTNVRRACSGLVRVDMAPVARPGGAAATTAGSSGDAGDGDAAAETAAAAAAARRQQQQVVLRGLVDSLNVSVATGILLHSLINAAATAAAETRPAPLAATVATAGPLEVAAGPSV